MNLRKAITRGRRRRSAAGLIIALALVPAARALVFELGQVKGHFDTTISVGGLYRLGEPQGQFYGLAAGGQQKSVNADDGNLNYEQGMASFLAKMTNDLLLQYKDSGLFVRGLFFDDFINSDGERARTPLSPEAYKIVGKDAELLDAYLFFNPTLGSMPASLRVGRQVVSWGESTFIPNGINSINPIDVAKLRTPGSELKEAFRPINMASGSLNMNESLTLEAFYLFEWENTRIDPPGTYFSSNDFVAKGGKKVYLGFGSIPDNSPVGAIPRGPDSEPGNSGQYGVNLRWLAKDLGDTEFGFYYMNYHSRLPLVSARTPTGPVNGAAAGAAAGAALGANTTFTTNLAVALGGAAGVPGAISTLVGAALTNVPVGNLPSTLQPFYQQVRDVALPQLNLQFLLAAATGQYLIEFPEDIHLYGASFNTSIKGTAIQGEISYRPNQPLQADDVELLFAALSPLSPAFGANNQLGNYAGQFSTYVAGYKRHAVWTGQIAVTKVTRGIFGADQSTFVAEAGFVSADLPSKNTLRYDGPGTYVAGDINEMINTGNGAAGADPASAFADSFSWGYQLVGRLDYNNAFAGINVSPLVVFTVDVDGNTPLPMGNFLHGRRSITTGVELGYKNAWYFDIRYVNFYGGDRFNLLGDRDYVSCNLKYSF